MKRISIVLALMLATMFVAAPAMADDTESSEASSSAEAPAPEPEETPTEEAPNEEAPVEEAPAPEPVVEEPVAEAPPEQPVEESVDETTPEPVVESPDSEEPVVPVEEVPVVTEPVTAQTFTEPPVDEFPDVEEEACWSMDESDGIEGTYEFPQTRADCTDGPPAPKCEEIVEYQYDTYWLRDQADKDYLDGLTKLNSPADDASLEPHDYYSLLLNGEKCPVTVIVVTPPAPPEDDDDDEDSDDDDSDETVAFVASPSEAKAVLPDTGAPSSVLALVGLMFVAAGAAVLRMTRRA